MGVGKRLVGKQTELLLVIATILTLVSVQSFFICLFGLEELKFRPHLRPFISFHLTLSLNRLGLVGSSWIMTRCRHFENQSASTKSMTSLLRTSARLFHKFPGIVHAMMQRVLLWVVLWVYITPVYLFRLPFRPFRVNRTPKCQNLDTFDAFDKIPPWLKGNCKKLGYITPTEVQTRALPVILCPLASVLFPKLTFALCFLPSTSPSSLERMWSCKHTQAAARLWFTAYLFYHMSIRATRQSRQ